MQEPERREIQPLTFSSNRDLVKKIIFLLSKLDRNVPIINSLEVAPVDVDVFVGLRTGAKPCS
jgi:hypothetical protein